MILFGFIKETLWSDFSVEALLLALLCLFGLPHFRCNGGPFARIHSSKLRLTDFFVIHSLLSLMSHTRLRLSMLRTLLLMLLLLPLSSTLDLCHGN